MCRVNPTWRKCCVSFRARDRPSKGTNRVTVKRGPRICRCLLPCAQSAFVRRIDRSDKGTDHRSPRSRKKLLYIGPPNSALQIRTDFASELCEKGARLRFPSYLVRLQNFSTVFQICAPALIRHWRIDTCPVATRLSFMFSAFLDKNCLRCLPKK